MGYRIDVRKDGAIIDSFDMPADIVIELLSWRAKNVPQEPVASQHVETLVITAPGAVKSNPEPKAEDASGKKVRTCSACQKAGHRSDTCPDSEKAPRIALPGNFAGTAREIDEVGASAFIRIRAKKQQGKSDEEIMDDENVTLGQFKAVIEASSYAKYRGRFAH